MTSTISQNLSNSSDVNFRIWAQWIHDKLTAAGWVNTADTGQVNLATMTVPTAGTAAGYEIWRMADSLQATYPIFMKIEYGSRSAGPNVPSVWVTLGSSTNGAGTITGQVGTRTQTGANGNATAVNCYFSGDTNRFGFAMGSDATSAAGFNFGVERTKASDGSDSNEGATLWMCSQADMYSGSGMAHTTLLNSGSQPPSSLGYLFDVQAGTTAVFGSDVYTFPLYPSAFYPRNPLLGVVGYFNADLTRETSITLDIYGANHTFLPLGSPSAGSSYYFSGNKTGYLGNVGRCAMRYE